jgi:CRP/FNR family cyclic AMP-dependent transcriptional regulator
MGSLIAVNQIHADVKSARGVHWQHWTRNAKSGSRRREMASFDSRASLDLEDVMKNCMEYETKETVFAQGDPATTVLFIQEGGVKLSVVNENGDGAVVGILGQGDFLGEGCLAGQAVRDRTAEAIMPSKILSIEKSEMIRFLQPGNNLFDRFFNYVLSRTIRVEEDLVDQILNPSEKRLARTLLLLARNAKQVEPHKIVPRISQETLAEMVGTTRPRVTHFMNKFRKLGFIKYDNGTGGLRINSSLLRDVLHG